jgi:hypothetical protein
MPASTVSGLTDSLILSCRLRSHYEPMDGERYPLVSCPVTEPECIVEGAGGEVNPYTVSREVGCPAPRNHLAAFRSLREEPGGFDADFTLKVTHDLFLGVCDNDFYLMFSVIIESQSTPRPTWPSYIESLSPGCICSL